jgi:hypothetical protein
MKLHPIFNKPYRIWWLIMAFVSVIRFAIFGFPTMYEENNDGYVFWTIGSLFTGLVFGSIVYLVYRLFAGKWNNKIFMILVTVMWFLVLVLNN